MKKLIISLLISCILLGFTVQLSDKEIKSRLLSCLKYYSNQSRNPGSYKNLVSDISSYSRIYKGVCNDNNCINRSYPASKIPKIKEFFNNAFNQKPSCMGNTFYSSNNYKESQEYFCSAAYDSPKLHYYCIEVTNYAYTLQMYVTKEKEVCKGFWPFRKCGTAQYEEARDLNQNEKNIVQQAVKSKSLDTFKSRYFTEYDDYVQESTPHADQKAGSDTQDKKTVDNQKIIFIRNLKRIIASYRRSKPNNYHSLVRNIQVTTDIRMDLFNKNELDSYISKHNLPSKVKDDLKIVAFSREPESSKDVKYELANGNTKAEAVDIIGYAVKEGDKLFFSYIRSTTTGTIPNRLKIVDEEKCVLKIWFIHWCYDVPTNVPNPLSQAELQTVKDALKYINLETIQKKIETISESQTLLGSEGAIYSPQKTYIAYMSQDGLIMIKNQKTGQIVRKLGMPSSTENKPYNLQVKENGNMFIINKNNDKVWTTNTASKGTAPFKLELSEDGKLTLKDAQNKQLYG